ncbi:MAG TPA: TIGR02253 family HAD-type hydrolase [Candidatus Methanofastidiosa archaeon]|nr:TIGR02253 family HAD-type hydrolase [Candidatus Methanofastidiosa archaeon]HPR41751.1 TIGR02253 family HAD-type hydrolase [Candidatus Methanofastidiosa archaeon]
MIKTVFFDLDDTLYNTTRLARLARHAAIHSMISKGLPLGLDKGYSRLMKIISETGSNASNHFDLLVEETLGRKDYKIVSAGIIGYHNTKFANITPFDDTISTLIELKKMGLSLNIISNGRAVKQWEKILRLGLEAFFDNVIISEEVGAKKPEREIYVIAMEVAGSEPGESVFIDNDKECILGARDVGMHTVLMDRVEKNIEPSVYDHMIDSLSDLVPLLKKI